MDEINIVKIYIKELMKTKVGKDAHCYRIKEADIGIVSPYKLQCRRINLVCKELGYSNITVGSAEIFQGQEKPIMIVSTVRSGKYGLGFVNDPKVCY